MGSETNVMKELKKIDEIKDNEDLQKLILIQDFKADFKKSKHNKLKNNTYNGIDRFYYVAPLKAIPLCIPDHAGLIEVYEGINRLELHTVKMAPKLNGKKITEYRKDPKDKIIKSIMWKYWKLSNKLNERIEND